MRRWVKWLALALVAVVVAVVVVAVVAVRPPLADARDAADHAWTPLRVPLIARYQALGGVVLALDASGAQGRTVTRDLVGTLGRWQRIDRTDDPEAQAPLANQLEGLALRVHANVAGSDRLKADPTLLTALGAFDRAVVSPPAVAAYNGAVRTYQRRRTGTAGRIVAGVFGFAARPVLLIAGG
jgi:hypothetical protein